jgi:DNA repair protein RadD
MNVETNPPDMPSAWQQSDAAPPILRSYQDEAVAAIRAAFARCRRVLFVLPTGGGKTVVFAFIVTNAAAKGNRVIVLAHRQEIADQISTALTAMGVAHGRIQPGYPMTGDPVQEAAEKRIAGTSSRRGAA